MGELAISRQYLAFSLSMSFCSKNHAAADNGIETHFPSLDAFSRLNADC